MGDSVMGTGEGAEGAGSENRTLSLLFQFFTVDLTEERLGGGFRLRAIDGADGCRRRGQLLLLPPLPLLPSLVDMLAGDVLPRPAQRLLYVPKAGAPHAGRPLMGMLGPP